MDDGWIYFIKLLGGVFGFIIVGGKLFMFFDRLMERRAYAAVDAIPDREFEVDWSDGTERPVIPGPDDAGTPIADVIPQIDSQGFTIIRETEPVIETGLELEITNLLEK